MTHTRVVYLYTCVSPKQQVTLLMKGATLTRGHSTDPEVDETKELVYSMYVRQRLHVYTRLREEESCRFLLPTYRNRPPPPLDPLSPTIF